MMQTPLLLLSAALPTELKAIPHIYQTINDFLLPKTIDSAVYNHLQRVVHVYGSTRPWTKRAMDGAAAKGDVDLVLWLLEHRSEGCSYKALIEASKNGHVDVVRVLFDKCSEQCSFRVAMKSAVTCGQAGVVEFLLKRFNVRGPMDDSSLNAATNGFVDVVRLLPSQNCAVEEALGLAAANGHLAVLEYLLFERRESYSSDEDDSHSALWRILTTPLAVQSQYGSTRVSTAAAVRAMCAAAQNDHTDAMELLVQNCSQEQLGFALAAAVAADSIRLVEMLVEMYEPAGDVCSHREIHSSRGKCYSASCSVERTLLDAVEANNIGMVQLLAKKAHVCVVNEAKSIATANGFTNVAEVLAAAAP